MLLHIIVEIAHLPFTDPFLSNKKPLSFPSLLSSSRNPPREQRQSKLISCLVVTSQVALPFISVPGSCLSSCLFFLFLGDTNQRRKHKLAGFQELIWDNPKVPLSFRVKTSETRAKKIEEKMSAKLLYNLSDENPNLNKQFGCMNGIFQVFYRQHYPARRVSVAGGELKSLPSGNISLSSLFKSSPLKREEKSFKRKLLQHKTFLYSSFWLRS